MLVIRLPLSVRTVRVRSANPIAPEKVFPIRVHPLFERQEIDK